MLNRLKKLAVKLESIAVLRDLMKDQVICRFIRLLETVGDEKASYKEFVR